MTDGYFKHVPHHEVLQHEKDGWRICEGWREYGHHVRWSLPMELPWKPGDPLPKGAMPLEREIPA